MTACFCGDPSRKAWTHEPEACYANALARQWFEPRNKKEVASGKGPTP